MLKMAYAIIAALRGTIRLVPSEVMIFLCKAYMLNTVACYYLLVISKYKKNIECANHYVIVLLLNLGNLATYLFFNIYAYNVGMAVMETLE